MRNYQQKHLALAIALGVMAIGSNGNATADEHKADKSEKKNQISIVITVDGDLFQVSAAGATEDDECVKELGHGMIDTVVGTAMVLAGGDVANDDASDKKSRKQIMIFRSADGENVQFPGAGPIVLRRVANSEDAKEVIVQHVATASGDTPHRIGVAISGTAGLVISNVSDDSPAKSAGLRSGDIVLSVNGEIVGDVNQLIDGVQSAGREGKPIKLRIVRGNETLKVEVTPTGGSSEKPAEEAGADRSERTRRRVQARVEATSSEAVQAAVREAVARAVEESRSAGRKVKLEAQNEAGQQERQSAAIRALREEVAQLRAELRELKRSHHRDSED